MPPRKSNVSTVSNGPDEATESPAPKAVKDGLSVEDLSLPKSMIARLAKGVLPPNTQIQKDALLALHKSATVFVSYIASNSNENTRSNNKKTISPADVFAALKDAELEGFLPRLEAELKKYNDIQCEKRNTYRRKVKEEKASTSTGATTTELTAPAPAAGQEVTAEMPDAKDAANGHVDGAERPTKKIRISNGGAAVPGEEVEGEGDGAGSEEDVEDEEDEGQDEEDAEEEEEDEEEEEEDGEESLDQTMMEEEEEEGGGEASGMHDEALDDPDSD